MVQRAGAGAVDLIIGVVVLAVAIGALLVCVTVLAIGAAAVFPVRDGHHHVAGA
ncbi:hypothetical protein [Nocardia fluminea]|uniref:hypothetical protein n=1 Tax=Nocardia fluminea TaxID=134984 RepID=UPI001472EE9C|nr:hypothetical protein [Nocardia fluminea]